MFIWLCCFIYVGNKSYHLIERFFLFFLVDYLPRKCNFQSLFCVLYVSQGYGVIHVTPLFFFRLCLTASCLCTSVPETNLPAFSFHFKGIVKQFYFNKLHKISRNNFAKLRFANYSQVMFSQKLPSFITSHRLAPTRRITWIAFGFSVHDDDDIFIEFANQCTALIMYT